MFLPPLIFEAAIHIRWQPFKREFPLLLMLVTVGVALAAVLVAAAMKVRFLLNHQKYQVRVEPHTVSILVN